MPKTLLIACSLLLLCGTAFCADQTITVIFRFDDYSNASPVEYDHKVIDAFKKRNMPLVIGVIPRLAAWAVNEPLVGRGGGIRPGEVLTAAKAAVLKEAVGSGLVEIALHGLTHQAITGDSTASFSEFAKIPYERQLERLRAGKMLLEEQLGANVATFIPPWNSYDLNTLAALEAAGFECISSDLEQKPVDLGSHLKLLPQTVRVKNVARAMAFCRNVKAPAPIIVVVFHYYTFTELGDEGSLAFPEFEKLLDWMRSQPDVVLRTMQQTCKDTEDLGCARYSRNMQLYGANCLVPVRLRNFDPGMYPSSKTCERLLGWSIVRAAAFHGAAFLVAFGVCWVIGPLLVARWPFLGLPFMRLPWIMFAGLSVFLWRLHCSVSIQMTAVAVGAGCCVGLLHGVRIFRKKWRQQVEAVLSAAQAAK